MFYSSPASFFYIPHLLHIFFFEPNFVYVCVCDNWFFYLVSTSFHVFNPSSKISMSIVLSQVLQVLSSMYLKTIMFLNMCSVFLLNIFYSQIITSSSHPFHTQNKTIKQKNKKPAKNNIKSKTMDYNKYKPLSFNNPVVPNPKF